LIYAPKGVNINTNMKKKLPKNRNPVAKFARKYNKAKVFLDRTKYNRKKKVDVDLEE
tara:strand:+ start:1201 stop:1371 length:171 start_codon:yes stop_codon:yes gene_type:complete